MKKKVFREKYSNLDEMIKQVEIIQEKPKKEIKKPKKKKGE